MLRRAFARSASPNLLEQEFLDASLAKGSADDEAARRGVQRLRQLLTIPAVVAALVLVAGAVHELVSERCESWF